MDFKKDQLFDNRYQLITNLGRGASAQVWLAKDTMANNLKVAIKILSSYKGIDTFGIQNFKKEFTFVYNLQHQNLLTPTNYAICDNIPYLVLPYCENGSSISMIGRADENDVIKFMHDVAAGLECLHAHDIIHQDIKPDNVLLDDDCNFLVTDFGISTQSAGEASDSSGGIGGTKAYMGPERFEKDATPIKMNDIWALGATAYELITGNAPFGDNGGLVQAQGEEVPVLPESLPAELRELIMSCLDAEPWNRPSAEVIRKKTQLYIETGSWKEKDGRRYLYGAIAAGVLILLLVGLGIWDYNRTKVFYYKDYVEFWGIPEGIGRLSGSEMRHRQMSYKLEFSQHKLRRMTLVNPEGNMTDHQDTETMLTRHTDVRYFYTDDGKIDYKTVYDKAGKLLYKMDYDESLKTVTFRQNDEYGTEMNLRANTTDLMNQNSSLFEEKSKISRYLLTYNNKGLLTKLLYVGLQNVPAGDADNVYGITYQYDKHGHKTEEQFIGADGQPTSNGIGLSIKHFEYDDNDNWCAVRYMNIDRGPSHDGNNCSYVTIESDEWGNRIKELYHTSEGERTIRTDFGVFGFSYIFDDEGHLLSQSFLGIDDSPMSCRYGYSQCLYKYDDNGYVNECSYVDTEGNPALLTKDGDSYSKVKMENNSHGLVTRHTYMDEEGNPIEQSQGYCTIAVDYDSIGNMKRMLYYDKAGKLALYNGLFAKVEFDYDEFSHVIAIRHLDKDDKPTLDNDGTSSLQAEYNRQGAVVKMSYYDSKGQPTIGEGYYSSRTWEYDELGNTKTWQFFDAEGTLTNNVNGIARCDFTYDSKTNFLILSKEYDNKGKLLTAIHRSYDKRGNIIKSYMVTSNGQLKQGTAVECSEYDANNRATKVWWTDLNGKATNSPGTKIAKILNKYDMAGNRIEQTFWNIADKPSVDDMGTFKRERKFNELGLVIYERNLDASGKPLSGKNVSPEGKVEYDKQGNLIKIECYDGYGKPRLSADGYFKMHNSYNKQGKRTEVAYYGLDGKLTTSKENEYAKKTTEYNEHGQEAKDIYYNDKNVVFRIDTYKYNEKNKLTEQRILNEKQQQDDKFWGFSKCVITYNKSGLIPTQRTYYNKSGTRLGYQNYNVEKKQWGQLVSNNPTHGYNILGDQWKQAIREAAAMCPVDGGNGVQIRSISLDGDIVICVIRLVSIDRDDMTEEQIKEVHQMMGPATAQLRKTWGLPSSVSLKLIIQDRNGNRL